MPDDNISILLEKARSGDDAAYDHLFGAVYNEMRQLAGSLMRAERDDHTLQASALVNEAYIRMRDQGVVENAANRRYLFGAANKVMRQILVDHARTRQARKRGGEATRSPLDVVIENFEVSHQMRFIDLDEALQRLESESPRQREVVELKFFSGLTIDEMAQVLECSRGTVENDWTIARVKLFRWLNDSGAE